MWRRAKLMTGFQPSEDTLLKDLIKTNRITAGETISKKQYEEEGDYNPWQAANRFGSWNEAKATAGVYAETRENNVTEEELLEDLERVSEETNLSTTSYREHGKYSLSTYYNRFQSFESAKEKAFE